MSSQATPVASATPVSSGKLQKSQKSLKDFLEIRTLETEEGGKAQFSFLTVDSPEKWQAANELHTDCPLVRTGTNARLLIPMTGISLDTWQDIEFNNPIPIWEQEKINRKASGMQSDIDVEEIEQPDQDFLLRQNEASSMKNVAIFEAATGQKIPGITRQDKAKFLQDRNPGEIDAVFLFCTDVLCNFKNDGQQLDTYNLISANSKPIITRLEGFDAWEKAADTKYIFRMQRPFDEYILEFPLRAIDQATRQRIEEETKQPDAPLMPKRNRFKQWDNSQMVPNLEDSGYLASCRAVFQKKTVMYLDKCLMFELPGVDMKSKYDWLGQRLAGDVSRLRRFIEDSMLSYRGHYNLFING